MLQRGEQSDDPKPTFAPLPQGRKIETVTLDEALEMFKLPRTLGTTDTGEEIIANIGRFGPYIKVGSLFVSIKPHDPFTIDEQTALKLYKEKLTAEKKKNVAEFPSGIKVLIGPYGPYITDGKKNAKIPKDVEPKDITEDQAKKLLDEAPNRKKRPVRRRKTA
jgi:DNA topoisomerase-1